MLFAVVVAFSALAGAFSSANDIDPCPFEDKCDCVYHCPLALKQFGSITCDYKLGKLKPFTGDDNEYRVTGDLTLRNFGGQFTNETFRIFNRIKRLKLDNVHVDGWDPLVFDNVHVAALNIENLWYNLPQGAFDRLKDLTRLRLAHFGPSTTIDPELLTPLNRLVSLSLYDANLNKLPGELLEKLPGLTTLSFRSNKITAVTGSDFPSRNQIEQLDLSSNPINSIDPSTWPQLANVKKLNLGQTMLGSLDLSDFQGMGNLITLMADGCTNLTTVGVTNNNAVPKSLTDVILSHCGTIAVDPQIAGFLQERQAVSVQLSSNKLLCEPGLKWIINVKSQVNIDGTTCSNYDMSVESYLHTLASA